jgi:hypothetical protein
MEWRAGIAAVKVTGEGAGRREQQNGGERCFHIGKLLIL